MFIIRSEGEIVYEKHVDLMKKEMINLEIQFNQLTEEDWNNVLREVEVLRDQLKKSDERAYKLQNEVYALGQYKSAFQLFIKEMSAQVTHT